MVVFNCFFAFTIANIVLFLRQDGIIYSSIKKSLGTRLESLHVVLCRVLSLIGRYFGSAEGSKFVEMASVDNVKRTWVNYGVTREWSDPTQGQVGGESVVCECMCAHFVLLDS